MNVIAVLAMLLLAGCGTPQTGAPAPMTTPPELTIQATADKVRAAAKSVMSDRGYQVTPATADTLLFDRTADLGSSAMYGFTYGKECWRRVRMTLTAVGAATRVTARPGLVINRGTAFEREEADNSQGAAKLIQQILGKIRDQAQVIQ